MSMKDVFVFDEVIEEGGIFDAENLQVYWESEDSSNISGSSDNVNVLDVSEKEEIDEEKLVDWSYKVMDWVRQVAVIGEWGEIYKRADDIITAFIVLVKPEHRGIVLDTLKVVGGVIGGKRIK